VICGFFFFFKIKIKVKKFWWVWAIFLFKIFSISLNQFFQVNKNGKNKLATKKQKKSWLL
jgi:hypothetical protein